MNIRGGWSMIIVFDSVCMLSLSKMQSRRSEVSFCNWIIFVCATHGMLKLNHLYLRIWLYWLLSECFLLLLPLKKLLVRSCFAWLVISYKGSFRNMNTVQKTCFNFYFFPSCYFTRVIPYGNFEKPFVFPCLHYEYNLCASFQLPTFKNTA